MSNSKEKPNDKRLSTERLYESKYGGGSITFANYLCELVFIRLAQKQKVRLPDKFWNNEKWRLDYKQQLVAAHALLKVYSPSSILNAINQEVWVTSLWSPKFKSVVYKFEQELEKVEEREIKVVEVEDYSEEMPIKKFGKKGKLVDL